MYVLEQAIWREQFPDDAEKIRIDISPLVSLPLTTTPLSVRAARD